MARRFIVRPLAEADLEDAARWYEDERTGLSERFFGDVDRTFARVRERPLQFPAVAGDVRRALLHAFPYAVYFRASDDIISVLAVLPISGTLRQSKTGGGASADKWDLNLITSSARRRSAPPISLSARVRRSSFQQPTDGGLVVGR